MKIAVIGGMNLDITGSVSVPMRMRDSNPGSILLSPGGVGRNIASALARHGAQVSLVTCLCSDLPAQVLASACSEEGIDLSLSYRAKGASSCYMAMHGVDGDLVCAVNDMAVMEEFPAGHIREIAPELNRFDAVVIDANLNESVLAAVAEEVRVPLIADPVSMHKCRKLLPYLNKLTAMKPNLDEARELTGEESFEAAGGKLLTMGAKNVFISLGTQGLYVCSREGSTLLKPEAVHSCQTNGAGDNLTAGIAMGLADGMNAADAARLGMRYARELLESRSGAK